MNLTERYIMSPHYMNIQLKSLFNMWGKLGLPSIPAMNETFTYEQFQELVRTMESIKTVGLDRLPAMPRPILFEPRDFDWRRDTYYVEPRRRSDRTDEEAFRRDYTSRWFNSPVSTGGYSSGTIMNY